MQKNNFVDEDVLITCLDMWEMGMGTDEILAQYPQQADSLRPVMSLLPHLTSLATMPSQKALEASRIRFLSYALQIACSN